MTSPPVPALPDQTNQLAQNLSGFDPTSVIAVVEQGLIDFLGLPVQQHLDALPLQRFPQGAPADAANSELVDPTRVMTPILDAVGASAAGVLSRLDPVGLITPVVNALGALGTGQFLGIDPTQALHRVSKSFDRTASSMGPAMDAATHDWQGLSGTVAVGKTRAAVADGAVVAAQADALRDNLSTAAATVAQARSQLIDIIDEYQAKMAAVDLSTPAGRATAVAAANQAHKESTALMRELRRTLDVQAAKVSAIGDPVPVTAAPTDQAAKSKPKPDHKKSNNALTVHLPGGGTARAPNKVAASAVRHALTQRGVPYRWGGEQPGKGFDCSGLTQWAYDKAGLDIPRVATNQDVGAKVSRGDVRPGDLAVWSGHVAMIVGDGKMIEAGDPIHLSPIRTTNQGERFEGFFRPTAD